MGMEVKEPAIKRFKPDFKEDAVEIHAEVYNKKSQITEKTFYANNIRKIEECHSENKLRKNLDSVSNINLGAENKNSTQHPINLNVLSKIPNLKSSPRERLGCSISFQHKEKLVFNYGNYSRYYGYRNEKDFQDVRLEVFAKRKDLFEGKEILDIGCNSGLITMRIAQDNNTFNIKHIIGLDIDKSLINKAVKFIEKKRRNFNENIKDKLKFPFNIKFMHGNYVLRDDVLLEIEREQFDGILCLSVTKWIHLNFGDNGLKQAFKRMFLQIRSGGYLILEPQPWHSYKRRKKLTTQIHENFKNISFFPEQFVNYLLGPEIGFCEMKVLDTPEHSSVGFRRPLQLFYKK